MTQETHFFFVIAVQIITVLASYFGAKQGAKQEIEKHYQTRWWNKRVNVYEEIVENLLILSDNAVNLNIVSVDGDIFSHKEAGVFSENFFEASSKLDETFLLGDLYLSDSALTLLKGIKKVSGI